MLENLESVRADLPFFCEDDRGSEANMSSGATTGSFLKIITLLVGPSLCDFLLLIQMRLVPEMRFG